MQKETNLFIILGEWWLNRKNTDHSVTIPPERRWLPSPGSILFTLLVVGLLVWAQTAGALPGLASPQSELQNSQSSIPYQGRLADADGNPVTATVNMIFRLYSRASGGGPLWEEQWTGSNGVQVSDGLFNVMLGSLTPIPQAVITGHDNLFLGITAGTDDEMTPRVQLGSVPFAVQALTVPDGSVTTDKLADGGVTSEKIAVGAVTQIQAPNLISSGMASNTKLFFGDDSVVASSVTSELRKTIILPTPCNRGTPKVFIQADYHHHPSVITTIGLPWDKTQFTVFFTGTTWSAGQAQGFDWLVICRD